MHAKHRSPSNHPAFATLHGRRSPGAAATVLASKLAGQRGGTPRKVGALAAAAALAAGVVVGTSAQAETDFSVRIASGESKAYTDPSGIVWAPDAHYDNGSVYFGGGNVAGTKSDRLYNRHRWGQFGYNVPVDCEGTYKVTLHFAENVMNRKGKRVFDVAAEGTTRISKLDVYAVAGSRAFQRSFDVAVKDKTLNLAFRAVVEDPMVSALEVTRTTSCSSAPAPAPTTSAPTTPAPEPTTAAPTTPPPSTTAAPAPSGDAVERINSASSSSYTDASGAIWTPDKGAVGGNVWQGGNVDVVNTTSDALYRKHRWGMSGYKVPVPEAGTYTVTLHLAELVFNASGRRVFDVTAEGALKVDDLDVFAAAGGANRALERSFNVPVSDGTLNLGFASSQDDPMVSAIEVAPAGSGGAPTTNPTTTPPPTTNPTTTPPPTANPTTPPPTTDPAPTTGFPNASNTGVPAGTQLESSGPITVTQNGAVISNKLVSGDITVLANNVTIKNTKVVGGRIAAGYGSEQSGLVVQDVEIDGQGKVRSWSAIGDVNYTCLRCNIHGTGSGPRAANNVLVQDSYVHDLCCYEVGDHRTAFGSNGGSNITLRHNTLDCGIGGCSSSTSFYGQWQSDNVLIERNLFNTVSGYCLLLDERITNARALDNVFGQKYNPRCGGYGTHVDRSSTHVWSGNKLEDGTPVNN